MADRKERLLARLKTIERHVHEAQHMVEADVYAIDLIKQARAIQCALDEVNAMILAEHLNDCVTTAIHGEHPEEREGVMGELLQIFKATTNVS